MTTTVTTATKPGFRTVFCAAALIIAPMLFIVAPLFFFGSDDPAVYLDEVRQDRTLFTATGLMITFAVLGYIPAGLGIVRLADRVDRGGILRVGGYMMATGGALGGVFFGSMLSPTWAATAADAPEIPVDFLADMAENTPWVLIGLVGMIGGVWIALLVVGVGLFRARAIPRWASAALILAVVVGFAIEDRYTVTATWLVVAVVLGLTARALLRPDPDRL